MISTLKQLIEVAWEKFAFKKKDKLIVVTKAPFSWLVPIENKDFD